MTREEFDKLVRRVEQRYASRPAALRIRVALLALIGYAGMLLWLGLVVIIGFGFIAVMFWTDDAGGRILCGTLGALVFFGGGYAVLRALLVRLKKPEGRPVTRGEAPELFAMLDELQAQSRSMPFHEVLIEPVCNAAVVQVPRLGVFGWPRNYLLIGLPMLDGLSRDEVRAVLAHEFAHLSRRHGRLGHWLYRLRRSWQELFKQLSAPRVRGELSLRPLVSKFVTWFWPRFNAHAFVLSRMNEYEADAESARIAGAENSASALTRFDVLSHQLEAKVWPDLLLLANEQPDPPGDLFLRLGDAIRAGPSAEDSDKWLDENLRRTSTNSDTHPCLTERLRALGASPGNVRVPPSQSAADALLRPCINSVRVGVQNLWSKDMATKWRDRHARAAALRHRLTSLEQAATGPVLDADRLWDKAATLLDLQGGRAAQPVLRQILELRPDHVGAQFQLGRLLLMDASPEGIAHLQRAMELDEQCVPQACSLLHNHYRLTGQSGPMRELDAIMDRYEKTLAASRAERSEVNARDSFISHELPEADLQSVRELLASEPAVSRARLARKELKHFQKQRLFVLCIYPRRPWFGLFSGDADRTLVNRLSQKLKLPGRTMVLSPTGGFRALARKLAGVPGAEIFQRPR